MKKLFMTPVWVLQVFTQTKSFSKNRVLGNRWLNTLGLHVARLILAHSIMRFRMWALSRGIEAEHRRSYYDNGYIVIPDFLPAASHTALKREIYNARAEVRECTQGDTLTHRIMLDQSTLPAMPRCQDILAWDRYRSLHRFAAGKRTAPISYIQTIKNKFIEGPPDPQKNLHSDTFHPTMKSWYFLDDVDESNGPFTYVPGSGRLSLARLKWEYRKSIECSRGGDRYSANGSFRITDADAAEMQLQPAKAFKVNANTLVIANTHGFHCRGNASERSTRTELWTISRSNPFNPLPGLDAPWINNLQNSALSAWRRYCDKNAAARGTVSSWHVINARNTIRHD
ncbi:MAG: phytanoyl-CoA dioxygenase family protein [Granulosicoccus sp.]|nr:phytanoyl-CoA dioxygenase family protein [Granulosicoccus sp.]